MCWRDEVESEKKETRFGQITLWTNLKVRIGRLVDSKTDLEDNLTIKTI